MCCRVDQNEISGRRGVQARASLPLGPTTTVCSSCFGGLVDRVQPFYWSLP
jgi:hypothetical protein